MELRTQIIPALGACLLALGLGPGLLLAQASRDAVTDGPALVVFAPWANSNAALDAAGWRPIGPTRAPFGILAAPDTANLASISHIGGALFTIRNDAFISLCMPGEISG